MFRVGDFARIECRGSSLISGESSLDPRLLQGTVLVDVVVVVVVVVVENIRFSLC